MRSNLARQYVWSMCYGVFMLMSSSFGEIAQGQVHGAVKVGISFAFALGHTIPVPLD
jgi:hypothetical protein